MGYDFKIEFKRGKENAIANALIRKGEEKATLALISFPTPIWVEELKVNYQESIDIQAIISTLKAGKQASRNYSIQQGLLFKKEKLIIVPSSAFHHKILNHIYGSPEAGHVGYHKTLQRAKLDFIWP